MKPSNKHKIFLVLPDLRIGGAQKMFVNMACQYAEQGHEVHLVLLTNHPAEFIPDNPNIKIKQFSPSSALKCLPAYINYIRTIGPDIIISAITYVNIISIIALFLSLQRHIKLIISERAFYSIDAKISNPKYLLERLCVLGFYRFSDKIIAVSKGVGEDITQIAKIPPQKVQTIYNPVVTNDLINKANTFIPHDLPSGQILMSCGRIEKIKDYPTQLKAFSLVYNEYPNLHLVILGSGSQLNALKDLADSKGIADRVHFLGSITNPMPYFKQADLFILSSKSEGFGNVLVEAMAMNTPVISTDCPSGPPEILKNVPNSLVPVGNSVLLADKIKIHLNNESQPFNYSQKANEFNVETICKQYLESVF